MEELIRRLNEGGVRYLLIGGQALRLEGMPRFSMDWDFLLPPRDQKNLARLNQLLAEELDMPVKPLGPHGENFVQTYQTRWGVVQFHLLTPGLRDFAELEGRSVLRETENGTTSAVFARKTCWPANVPRTDLRTNRTSRSRSPSLPQVTAERVVASG
jgi:hypothetical protein